MDTSPIVDEVVTEPATPRLLVTALIAAAVLAATVPLALGVGFSYLPGA